MAEAENNPFREIDETHEAFQDCLRDEIAKFLVARKYTPEDPALAIEDVVRRAARLKPRLPTQLSVIMNFHEGNMRKCRSLAKLQEYALKNGFRWLDENEMQECKYGAIESLGFDSDNRNG